MSFLTDNMKQYPNEFFDFIKVEMDLKNDAQLSRLMGINQATLCRLRYQTPHSTNNTIPRVNDSHMLSLYDATGLSIEILRSKLYQHEFKKPALTPHEIVQRRLAEENEVMAERQRAYRESIKNETTISRSSAAATN